MPAWAGRSCEPSSVGHGYTADPRVGGAEGYAQLLHPLAGGRSPRGRGGADGGGITSLRRRPIPAWAGRRTYAKELTHA